MGLNDALATRKPMVLSTVCTRRMQLDSAEGTELA